MNRQSYITRRLTSDPNRSSLGLLPSGPDPVGEWLVHRQPPVPYIGGSGADCKRRRQRGYPMDDSNPPPAWTLHPQLEADTATVGDLPLSRLLVSNDASFPWLLLVPRRPRVREIIDLSDA